MGFLSSIFKGSTEGVLSGAGELMKDVREVITGEPDAEKKLEYLSKYMDKQLEWGITEARHKSIFVAGWRPAVGWICAFALGYMTILAPTLHWIASIYDLPAPPIIDTSLLISVLTGMLGLSGIRSFDKAQGNS